MWSNDIKCKYMFMFSLNNLARKELSLHSPFSFMGRLTSFKMADETMRHAAALSMLQPTCSCQHVNSFTKQRAFQAVIGESWNIICLNDILSYIPLHTCKSWGVEKHKNPVNTSHKTVPNIVTKCDTIYSGNYWWDIHGNLFITRLLVSKKHPIATFL